MTEFYGLVLGVLGVWRITHLLHAEDGPGDTLVHFRERLGKGFWRSVVECFYCLSLWVAIPFAVVIGRGWEQYGLLWLACSAGAILLERVTQERAAWYVEHKEGEHELLPQAGESLSRGEAGRSGA